MQIFVLSLAYIFSPKERKGIFLSSSIYQVVLEHKTLQELIVRAVPGMRICNLYSIAMSTLLVLVQTSFSWSMYALGAINLNTTTESDKAILDRHYKYFKDKPGRDLIESIVKFQVLHPPDSVQALSPKQGDWIPSTDGHAFSARPGISVQTYLAETLKDITDISFRPRFLQIWYV